MEFIWAIAGLIIGVIARLLRPGKQNIPLWLTILIGMAGAIIGNLLASAIGVRTPAAPADGDRGRGRRHRRVPGRPAQRRDQPAPIHC